MRKKIMHILLFALLLIIPLATQAASQCPSNLPPSLQATDPACWTSASSGYWTDCVWERNGIICYWPSVWDSSRNYHTTGSCQSGSIFHANAYKNSCTSEIGCDNGYYDLSGYRIWVGSTSYTCYYTTVKTWSTCSVTTGIRYATEVTQREAKDTTSCENLNEATVQTCGVCTPGTNINVTQMPTTSGICAFGTPTTPVLANDEWTWQCKGSNNNIADDDAACSVPNNADGACNSTATGDYAWNATGFRGELCSSGIPTIDRDTSFPAHGETVTWGCSGIGTGNPTAPDACRATRGTPPPCDCGSADDVMSTNKPNSGLCDVGDASSVSGSTVWQWTCGTKDGAGICTNQAQCSAECINISIDTPEFVYLQQNSTTLEARITIQGRSHTNGISCTLNGQNVTFAGTNETSEPVNISVTGGQTELTASCNITDPCGGNAGATRLYTTTKSVQSVCAQRTCNAQGTCQATPQPAASLNECTSSCNSDADCSSGRMIETRP